MRFCSHAFSQPAIEAHEPILWSGVDHNKATIAAGIMLIQYSISKVCAMILIVSFPPIPFAGS